MNKINSEIKEILTKWFEETAVENAALELRAESKYAYTLHVYTTKPGWLIGCAGNIYDKYREEIVRKSSRSARPIVNILLHEVDDFIKD